VWEIPIQIYLQIKISIQNLLRLILRIETQKLLIILHAYYVRNPKMERISKYHLKSNIIKYR